jgi:hypothetical protein
MRLQGMPGRDTLFVHYVQVIVEADARSPYNYRVKPCKAFQGLKDISRVCLCKYRGVVAKVPYKTSKFQRLSAIVTMQQRGAMATCTTGHIH